MCKVTRNGRGGVVSVRSAAQNGPPLPLKQAENISAKYDQLEEHKLSVLPQTQNKQIEVDEKVASPMLEENDSQIASNSTIAAVRPTSAHSAAKANPDSMDASLRAISALCLPEAPNVLPGAVIRECLLGQVSLGSYVLGANQFLPVVVKEFNLSQVLKKTTKTGQSLHEDALVELQIHAYIQKKQVKNVIGLYAMHMNQATGKLSAYLEYAAKGELFSMLQGRSSPLPLKVCGNFLVQLLQGVASLHSINVVHRDLSLENVLLTADNELKICDFGLATISAAGDTINDGRTIGKVKYMCPEVYYGEGYDGRLADVWSSAVIFFLLLTNVFPYERPSAEDPRLVMLCHGQINELLAHWQRPALDNELLEVFSHMFCPPQQRWSAAQLLQLPFCQRYANVSKAELAAALTPQTSSGSPSADESIPSVAMSSGSVSPCSSATASPRSSDSNSPSAPLSRASSLSSTISATPMTDTTTVSCMQPKHVEMLEAMQAVTTM